MKLLSRYPGSDLVEHVKTEQRNVSLPQLKNLKILSLYKPREVKVYKSVHHRTIQINHQLDATIFQFIILTFIYSSSCFGRFPAHHQKFNECSGSLWFYLRIVVIVVLCSWSGRPAVPTTNTARLWTETCKDKFLNFFKVF